MTTSIKRNFLAKEILTEARSSDRPTAREMFTALADDHKFYELHGDRKYGDDGAMCGGIGQINGQAVSFVGTQKGHDVEENITANFGSPMRKVIVRPCVCLNRLKSSTDPLLLLLILQEPFVILKPKTGELVNQSPNPFKLWPALKSQVSLS